MNRGTTYARKGQYERAIEDLDQAVRLNPNEAQAFNNRGQNKPKAIPLEAMPTSPRRSS